METGTMTLSDFLLARIDEDEHAARDTLAMLGEDSWLHTVGYDPNRAIADCQAKRRIVSDAQCVLVRWNGEWVSRLDGVMRHLASPYAAHADYRDEWRP